MATAKLKLRTPGKSILNGRANLQVPTPSYRYFRITWKDTASGKWRSASGGRTEDGAIAKAAAILGDFSPESTFQTGTPPTVREVFDDWIGANRAGWSSRTVDNYTYVMRRFLDALGDHPITAVKPSDITAVDFTRLSRGQQSKVRSGVRAVFRHAGNWVKRDEEVYAAAIRLSGTSADKRSFDGVQKGDIPSGVYVTGIIDAAAGTCQFHPAFRSLQESEGFQMDPQSGEKIVSVTHRLLSELGEFTHGFHQELGLPLDAINRYRRGIPRHYKNVRVRRETETLELAGRFRQLALGYAIGAGVGLRIGEMLALRVDHFLSEYSDTEISLMFRRSRVDGCKAWKYRGRLSVHEQASQASQGRIVLSPPKNGKSRMVWLPAVLFHGSERDGALKLSRRQHVVKFGGDEFSRFTDPAISLWNMSDEECLTLWRSGVVPLGWMLFQRFSELWDEISAREPDQERRVRKFRKLLLFPTRNPQRANSSLEVPDSWSFVTEIVPGFGSYQSQANFAGRLANPVYDSVSEKLNSWPASRRNRETRQGWSHHSLRHYAASSMLVHGVPLPVVSEQLGHASYDFTLKRYIHAIQDDFASIGFE